MKQRLLEKWQERKWLLLSTGSIAVIDVFYAYLTH